MNIQLVLSHNDIYARLFSGDNSITADSTIYVIVYVKCMVANNLFFTVATYLFTVCILFATNLDAFIAMYLTKVVPLYLLYLISLDKFAH